MTANEKIIKALENGNRVHIHLSFYKANTNRQIVKAEISGVSGLYELSVRGINGFDWEKFRELGLARESEIWSKDGKTRWVNWCNK